MPFYRGRAGPARHRARRPGARRGRARGGAHALARAGRSRDRRPPARAGRARADLRRRASGRSSSSATGRASSRARATTSAAGSATARSPSARSSTSATRARRREFLRWYAPHQLADGKMPCCVDARGADPTPEHDSDGEFLYAIARVPALTRDRGASRASSGRASARRSPTSRRSARSAPRDAYRAPENGGAFFGLLPESISHEGYSKQPVHSYWDDLFALRGLRDAAWLAGELGHGDEAEAPGRALAGQLPARPRRVDDRDDGARRTCRTFPRRSSSPTSTPPRRRSGSRRAASPRRCPRTRSAAPSTRYGDELARRISTGQLATRRVGAVRDPHRGRVRRGSGSASASAELLELALADRRPPGWRQWPEIVWQRRPRAAVPRRPAARLDRRDLPARVPHRARVRARVATARSSSAPGCRRAGSPATRRSARAFPPGGATSRS